MELSTNSTAAAAFVNAIMPAKMTVDNAALEVVD